MLLASAMPACLRHLANKPQDVAQCFLEAIQEGSLEKLDSLMNWDEAAANAFYVTRDFMKLQSKEQRDEALNGFKQRIREDVLPLAKRAEYQLLKVYVSRWKSDAVYKVAFPESSPGKDNKLHEQEFTITMNLDLNNKRWYITDLSNFISQNTLQGNFKPDSFYLSKPIRP